MKPRQIRAIGYFLSSYESDLTYISQFKKFRQKKISIEDYSIKNNHSFYSFLSEFRVARNINHNSTAKILALINTWLDKGSNMNIDKFAIHLKRKNLTHGKIMTSLSSKIFFLNNPQKIMPIDTRVKKSVNQKSNLYKDYLPLIKKIKKQYKDQIDECLIYVKTFSEEIESRFNNINNKEAIRKNRMIDKFLWTINGALE